MWEERKATELSQWMDSDVTGMMKRMRCRSESKEKIGWVFIMRAIRRALFQAKLGLVSQLSRATMT